MAAQKNILVLGTRRLAEELADLIEDVEGLRVAGFVENTDRQRCGTRLQGRPVWWIDEIEALVAHHQAVCGLSTTFRSRFVHDAERIKLPFTQVIHPTAHVSRTARIGQGTVVGPGVIVAAHAVIGDHVYLNRGALVGHHSVLGDYVTVGPGANIAGCCQIAAATYIAMSAVVLDGLKIGGHSVIGAGAVVTKDVPDHVQTVGVPARITQQGIPGK